MRESAYNATLAQKLEKEVGGKVLKVSDRATLGLPDSLHLLGGIATYFEVKLDEDSTHTFICPWDYVKNDIRQFEVCLNLSKYTQVLFGVYFPKLNMTLVLPIEKVNEFRYTDKRLKKYVYPGPDFVTGHGVEIILRYMKQRKEEILGQR